MTDVLAVAVIVAFFVVAAIVVRLLDGMISRGGTDYAPGADPAGETADEP
jgi:hypothetical protein